MNCQLEAKNWVAATFSGEIICERIVPPIQPDKENTGVRIEETEPSILPEIPQNLITNALKVAKPGVPPWVRIYQKTHPQGEPGSEFVDIYVEDNGIG